MPTSAHGNPKPAPRFPTHSEANISFYPFYKNTFKAFFACYVAIATHYNNCSPPPRPREEPVGASPGLAEGFIVKRTFSCILFINTVLKADSYLWRWRGPRPLHCCDGRVSIRARGRARHWCTLSLHFFPSQTMVAQHLHTPLWVRRADVDSTHQTLMGD